MTERPHSLCSERLCELMADLAKTTPEGCFMEVGVYMGGSAWNIYNAAVEQGRKIYLYDTFTGIPYKGEHDSHQVGDFSNGITAEQCSVMYPKAMVRQGIFPASALEMGPIAFVHLDVDQYQSYKDAIEYLKPRMVKGGYIWMDDADCLEGAKIAVKEANLDLFKVETKIVARF